MPRCVRDLHVWRKEPSFTGSMPTSRRHGRWTLLEDRLFAVRALDDMVPDAVPALIAARPPQAGEVRSKPSPTPTRTFAGKLPSRWVSAKEHETESTAEQDEAIAAVTAAEKAAALSEGRTVLRHLKAAWKWTIGFAERLARPLRQKRRGHQEGDSKDSVDEGHAPVLGDVFKKH